VYDTAARLLRLLTLLQARPDRAGAGAELADRLGHRAYLRRDVQRLRGLGYPVDATSGVAGGYRLGSSGVLPPLLLDDEEAVAVAVALRTTAAGTVAGVQETSLRALAKLEQVLPARLRHHVAAFQTAAVPLPGTAPDADPAVLAAVAGACRRAQRLRLRYTSRHGTVSTRTVEPVPAGPHRPELVPRGA
jgi:predicted DNA-binding transcriptional regulator YafY